MHSTYFTPTLTHGTTPHCLNSGDGLLNSADTGVAGDTNGDGVVDGRDTGLVGECSAIY